MGQLNVEIPDDLHNYLRKRSIDRDVKIGEVTTEVLERGIEEIKNEAE